MRIIFLGTPDFAVPPLAALLDAGHDVACVVTQPDRPCGRHRRLAPPPVKEFARARGLPVRQTDDVNKPAFIESLAQFAPELIVVAAFGQKLERPLLRLAPHGCLNVHSSLLPRHRGAAPVAHAILAGDAETGVTIMRVNPRMDAGDILLQESTPISPRETAGELTERLAGLGACLLVTALSRIAAGKAEFAPQDPRLATLAPSLDKSDGAVDWTRPASYLARFVRAMNPWPGAFTYWLRPDAPPLRLVLHQAEAVEGPSSQPGRIAAAGADLFAVETGAGLLRILSLQPAGGRPMAASEFLRGHAIAPGHTFGQPPK